MHERFLFGLPNHWNNRFPAWTMENPPLRLRWLERVASGLHDNRVPDYSERERRQLSTLGLFREERQQQRKGRCEMKLFQRKQQRLSGDDFQKLLACLSTSEPMDDLRTHLGPTSDPDITFDTNAWEVKDAE